MTDDMGRNERKQSRRRLFLINGFLTLALILLQFLQRPIVGVDHPIAQAVLLVCLAALVVYDLHRLTLYLRRRRATRAKRVEGQWPLGADYAVAIDEPCNGTREPGQLAFGEKALRLTWTALRSSSAIDFAAIRAVRVRPSFVEIDTGDSRVRVVPDSFETRQRLLWEFAVRCNTAMERGIDDENSKSAYDAANAPSAQPVPDASSLPNLGSGVSGLGSALAGPADRGNPAPPRKSGLGVGLFAPPPEE